MDSSSWQAYAKPDPELEALLPLLPPHVSFADYGDAETLRKAVDAEFAEAIAAGTIKLPDLSDKKSDIQVPVRDGSSIRAVHYRPAAGTPPGPILVDFHGGGFVFAAPEGGEPMFKVLMEELGMTVVSVAYRKAPEHKFPTAAHDAIDSVAENASQLGADASKGLIVGGLSAGGNLAMVAAHAAADMNLSPPVTGVFLNNAPLLYHSAVPEKYKPHYQSWEQNKDARILDRRGYQWFLEQYEPVVDDPLFSPFLWPSGHKSQPPTYFQVCGMDPLRDEGLIYDHVLREDGVPTRVDIYPGLPHAAAAFMPMLSVAAKSLADAKAGIEWMLNQGGGLNLTA